MSFYQAAGAKDPDRLCRRVSRGARRSMARFARVQGIPEPSCAVVAERVLATFARRAEASGTTVRDVRLRGERADVALAAERTGLPLVRENGAWKVSPFAVPRVRARLKVDTACSMAMRHIAVSPLPPIRRSALGTYYRRIARVLRADARGLAAVDVSGRPARDRRTLLRELRAVADILDGLAARLADGAELVPALEAGERQLRSVDRSLRRARKRLRADCGGVPWELAPVRAYARTTMRPACRRATRRLKRLGTPSSAPAVLATYFDGAATAVAKLAGSVARAEPLPMVRRTHEQTVGTLRRLARAWRAQAAAARRVDQAGFDRARRDAEPLLVRGGSGLYRLGLSSCL